MNKFERLISWYLSKRSNIVSWFWRRIPHKCIYRYNSGNPFCSKCHRYQDSETIRKV